MSLVALGLTWTFKTRYDENYLENSMQVFLPQIIPIFPLPNVVLFPNTHLPLHIFEYRYREMIQDILEGINFYIFIGKVAGPDNGLFLPGM